MTAKTSKLKVRDVADVPLREVSGLAVSGSDLLAVGDHDPAVFIAPLDGWPLDWRGIDLAAVGLPDGGTQFEAVEPAVGRTVLVLQEQPARVLSVDLDAPALLGTLSLEVPDAHPLRTSWLGDRSSRGESVLLLDRGHLLVVKEKSPPVILEFGPASDDAVGWQRGGPVSPPSGQDAALTVLATWTLGPRLTDSLPDVSDAAVGPDGRLYLLSDQGSAIARLPEALDPRGGVLEAEAVWRIAGRPEKAEGLVILADGTPLVALDTKAPRGNLLRLDPLPMG